MAHVTARTNAAPHGDDTPKHHAARDATNTAATGSSPRPLTQSETAPATKITATTA